MPAATVRSRFSRAAAISLVATAIATAMHLVVGLPIGNQPEWLALGSVATITPGLYLVLPLRDAFYSLTEIPLESGVLHEVETIFGPAMRAGVDDIALMALGTLVVVGLAGYLAAGVQEMVSDRRHGATVLG